MVLNIVTFLIIQLPAFKNPYGEIGAKFDFIYPAYIVSLLFCLAIFVAYIWVNYKKVSEDDKNEDKQDEENKVSPKTNVNADVGKGKDEMKTVEIPLINAKKDSVEIIDEETSTKDKT